jgi:UDP-N-acetylmuramoyl-L-alanyl-D-glutamate--2,6-diaminopimelate ligase
VLLTRSDHPFGARLLKQPGVTPYSVRDEIRSGKVKIGGEDFAFRCPLYGSFQFENILAATSVCSALGVPGPALIQGLKDFPGVPGRMEAIENTRGLLVFVDYAHKPEALEKVLQSIQGKVITCVFGCGGDRDRSKRPVMGEIASRLSARVIVTSDNPRTENPSAILKEIEAGLAGRNNYQIIEDRREAIRVAIREAKPGEIVLIAGKGHEDYQIVGVTKRHFDDREEARAALAEERP